jgi:hypothetical protein
MDKPGRGGTATIAPGFLGMLPEIVIGATSDASGQTSTVPASRSATSTRTTSR